MKGTDLVIGNKGIFILYYRMRRWEEIVTRTRGLGQNEQKM